MHRWFNNQEAISSLMEVARRVHARERRGLDRRGGRRRRRRRGPQVGDRGRGASTSPSASRPSTGSSGQTRARARRPDRRPSRRAGVGREAERLTVAKAFEEFGAHRVYGRIPAFNVPGEEGRQLAGLAARGHDAGAHPPPRRDADRLRGLGNHAPTAGSERWGATRTSASPAPELIEDARRGRGRGRVLPQPPVPRRRGGHPHAARRARASSTAAVPLARPRDPGLRPPRRDLSLLLPRGARSSGAPIDPADVDLAASRAGQRLRPRPPRRPAGRLQAEADRSIVLVSDPAEPRKSRMSDRQQIRKNEAAGYAVERVEGPAAEADDLAAVPRRLHRDHARRRRRPSATSSTPTTSPRCSPRRSPGWSRSAAPRAMSQPPPSRSAATGSCTTTSRERPTTTAAGRRRRT